MTEKERLWRKEYYLKHKEELKERSRKYYEDHKEELKERSRKYYEDHKEELKERSRKYYEDHKERYKEYYEANKDAISQSISPEDRAAFLHLLTLICFLRLQQ